ELSEVPDLAAARARSTVGGVPELGSDASCLVAAAQRRRRDVREEPRTRDARVGQQPAEPLFAAAAETLEELRLDVGQRRFEHDDGAGQDDPPRAQASVLSDRLSEAVAIPSEPDADLRHRAGDATV